MKTISFFFVAALTISCSEKSEFYYKSVSQTAKKVPILETLVKQDPKVQTREVGLVTEEFIWPSQGKHKLDVIWVVDNSGSMSDEQQDLGNYFSYFIDDFLQQDIDFKMAITTTDGRPGHKGKMVPESSSKLTSKSANLNQDLFKSDFQKMINVGINGSGTEMGQESLNGFLKLYGNNFLRKDAYLAVIMISDEEDQSPNGSEFYVKNLKSFKKNPGLVKVYSIVDTQHQNSGHSTIATGFKRYAQMSKSTGGNVFNIRDDFAGILGDMGHNILNQIHTFALTNEAVEKTIKVKVDDREEIGFSYNVSSSSIVFDENSTPKADSKITVTYQVKKIR